jgi:hypothetical protein
MALSFGSYAVSIETLIPELHKTPAGLSWCRNPPAVRIRRWLQCGHLISIYVRTIGRTARSASILWDEPRRKCEESRWVHNPAIENPRADNGIRF